VTAAGQLPFTVTEMSLMLWIGYRAPQHVLDDLNAIFSGKTPGTTRIRTITELPIRREARLFAASRCEGTPSRREWRSSAFTMSILKKHLPSPADQAAKT
jgi:hypothetical protein